MKFFGREKELVSLRKIRDLSHRFARLTVLTGRRRVGKTQLVKEALDDGHDPYLHLAVTRKVEKVQCAAMKREAERVLGLPSDLEKATRLRTDRKQELPLSD